MNEFAAQGPVLVVGAIIGLPLGLLLAALIFRSACDLCSVEPPGWWKCVGIVVAVGLLGSAIGFLIGLVAGAVGRSAGTSDLALQVIASMIGLGFQTVLAAVIYKPLLHVGFLKALLISVIQMLLTVLVMGVMVLLFIGGFTLLEGIFRLI